MLTASNSTPKKLENPRYLVSGAFSGVDRYALLSRGRLLDLPLTHLFPLADLLLCGGFCPVPVVALKAKRPEYRAGGVPERRAGPTADADANGPTGVVVALKRGFGNANRGSPLPQFV